MSPFTLLRVLIATKLGACAFCIRLSLGLSLATWAVFAVLRLWIPDSLAATWALVPALGFTTLFASHLVAYAVRVVVAYRGRAARTAGGRPVPGRRRFLAASAQAIALALLPAAVASVLGGSAAERPDCPRPANCLSGCCCQRCKTGLKKCDPEYLSCSYLCAASCVG
jgi:hypothetical protein